METLKRKFDHNALPSSSPAFGTPLHPFPTNNAQRPPLPPPAFKPAISTTLPILLPPPTLRPLAFRTFTKKHNLTLTSSALQALAAFIGRHCGSGWREEGTGEKVLEEVARMWKNAAQGEAIVEDGERLKLFLKTLEGCMSGGRIQTPRNTNSMAAGGARGGGRASPLSLDERRRPPSLERHGSSFGMSGLHVDSGRTSPEDDEEHGVENCNKDPRSWLKVVSAFEQPRFTYDVDKKHFFAIDKPARSFPSPTQKTALFRERYHVIHQRLQRNAAFQAPSISAPIPTLKRQGTTMTEQQFYKLTPIANLLGRGGTSHLLLGMLVVAPTGTLAVNDLTGSISLNLQHSSSMQSGDAEPYFCPGMIVLVDGVYEEDWTGAGSSGLGNTGGVGGTIGGRFVAFQIGAPPVEQRNVSLGINLSAGEVGGAFGWTNFLGQGPERAIGSRMRKVEQKVIGQDAAGEAKRKIVVISNLTLDRPSTLSALRKVLEEYAADDKAPMSFILTGDFSSRAAMAGAGTGSIEYKELFNDLAAVLSEFPSLLRTCTWIFVPGDNDPWASSFSAGSSTMLPRDSVPELFTSRIKRAFAAAKADGGPSKKDSLDGEAIWTSNPTRVTLFGPAHEMVVFRDDVSARLRRNAVRIGQASNTIDEATAHEGVPGADDGDIVMSGALPSDGEEHDIDQPLGAARASGPSQQKGSHATLSAKRLILSLLPQSTVSPFPLSVRPTHWDYAPSALSLYPLPHTLILADPGVPPFALTYEGCHVVNPGRFVEGEGRSRRKKVQWVEYDGLSKRATCREMWL